MDSQKFNEAAGALQRLVDANVQELSWASADLSADGIPVDWIADIVNLTAEQRNQLADIVGTERTGWYAAFRQLLLE